ncbi:Senescence-specific cysteine protease SAG39-like protein [Drosera capensis]
MAFTHPLGRFMLLASLFLGLQLLAIQGSRPLNSNSSMVKRHEEWMAQYGRTYKDDVEKARRFEIFKRNVELIDAHNQMDKGFTLGENSFTDLSDEEFQATYTGLKGIENLESMYNSASFKYENITSAPASVDWVAKGAVTPIKHQGQCGSCWTFATSATIEGLHKITTGKLVSLSEQQILDCDIHGHQLGCKGGYYTEAYKFVKKNGGLTTETNYPYVGRQQTCKKNVPVAAKIGGYQQVPRNNEKALQNAVANQPVAVAVDSNSTTFKNYKSGVYKDSCGTRINHAVTVVGYGQASDGTPYWLIKNSWGTTWGEKGYMKLQRNIKDRKGRCGVAMIPAYPTK